MADLTPTDFHRQTGFDFGSDPNLPSGVDDILSITEKLLHAGI